MASPPGVIHWAEGEPPALRDPVALLAFGGWLDAGSAGTGAVRFLRNLYDTIPLARLDYESFYSYTDTRPFSVMVSPGERTIRTPRLQLAAVRMPETAPHDLVLLAAPEPNLRWPTYANAVVDVLERVGARSMFLLGAIFGAVYHKAQVPLTGWATRSDMRLALRRHNIAFTEYQGPTGFVTQQMVTAHDRGLAATAVTGFCPNYIQGVPNPRVSLALLRAVSNLSGVPFELGDLQRAARALERQVDRLLNDQPELREQVERLMSQVGQMETTTDEPEPEPTAGNAPAPPGGNVELPSPQAVVQELEEFLKQLRTNDDEGGKPGESGGPSSPSNS